MIKKFINPLLAALIITIIFSSGHVSAQTAVNSKDANMDIRSDHQITKYQAINIGKQKLIDERIESKYYLTPKVKELDNSWKLVFNPKLSLNNFFTTKYVIFINKITGEIVSNSPIK